MDGLITKHVAACELAAVLCMHTDESNDLWQYAMEILDGYDEKVPEQIRRLNLQQFRTSFVVPFAVNHLRKVIGKSIERADAWSEDSSGFSCSELDCYRVLSIQ